MIRMGFGLSVVFKFMDVIIRWVIRVMSDVDNYVDDVRVSLVVASGVFAEFYFNGLFTKLSEFMVEVRVLGL